MVLEGDEFPSEDLLVAGKCRENKLFYSSKDEIILENFAQNNPRVYPPLVNVQTSFLAGNSYWFILVGMWQAKHLTARLLQED
ncbi:hypothetical protein CEXT_182001 [Caerostris extrusa]|uniref:Uncharacterized protein n=1 Tax=Caerostris extrusa TaxID=172846 RepID=A0AAV4Y5X1_CAEEX|nr:hypothetical protein CEXT_182001 [Caerostris extrusa]